MALENYLADEIALDCAEGFLTRREALRRLALLGLTATGAAALLAACGSSGGGGGAASSSAAPAPIATAAATTTTPASTRSAATSNAVAELIRFLGPTAR